MSRRYAAAHPCPTPSKIPYSSLEEANAGYSEEVVKPLTAAFDKCPARFAYQCACGSWHRTGKSSQSAVELVFSPAEVA